MSFKMVLHVFICFWNFFFQKAVSCASSWKHSMITVHVWEKKVTEDVFISLSAWLQEIPPHLWKCPWGKFTLETTMAAFNSLGIQVSSVLSPFSNPWSSLPSVLMKIPGPWLTGILCSYYRLFYSRANFYFIVSVSIWHKNEFCLQNCWSV